MILIPPGHRRLAILTVAALVFWTGCAQTTPPAQSPGTLRIYLARHGKTDWNAQGRTQGHLDIPLNATGREQAAALRDTLNGVPLDGVYSSTLTRSRDTAQIARPDARIVSLDSLREQHRGKFQGSLASDPELVRRERDPNDTLDGGESLNQLTDRVRAALDQIRREHPSGSVLIVGHNVTNRMILRVLLDLTIEQATAIRQANNELYLIELDAGGRPRLWKLIPETNLGEL